MTSRVSVDPIEDLESHGSSSECGNLVRRDSITNQPFDFKIMNDNRVVERFQGKLIIFLLQNTIVLLNLESLL